MYIVVNRKITVATQVDSSCWNEEKTIRNISNVVTTEIDQRSVDTEKFHIKCVENKCKQLELVAFPDVFKTPQTLRKAVISVSRSRRNRHKNPRETRN